MNEPNPQTTAPSALPPRYVSWAATLLLVIPALGMLFVSLGLLYPPVQFDAAIFVALQHAPQWMRFECYGATLIGLYALYSVRKGGLLGVSAAVLLALAYVHLHLALLNNVSIPAWLAVLAAVVALIGGLVRR